ncbi:hypothetical protein BC937DRAFT_92896 [Endogone sp. FLAS-F59071]|nr:hypothetical protein BC937DRAFT_92896 [Endogone sp. FLAS-F59071]|eukprot:RUS21367.1 hypothetical protein BC937DRAFT_92896 [Endogone sp. FLAS-F59071]
MTVRSSPCRMKRGVGCDESEGPPDMGEVLADISGFTIGGSSGVGDAEAGCGTFLSVDSGVGKAGGCVKGAG